MGCVQSSVMGQPPKILASAPPAMRPARPRNSANNDSPAMRPPPTSDVDDMSSGNASPSPGEPLCLLGLRAESALMSDATMPPSPNHTDVVKPTKPPNDDAYGDAMMSASSVKSIVLLVLFFTRHAW